MESLVSVLIGAFIGLNAGMFGVGGALVATPLLRLLLGLPAVLAVATPLPAAIPAAISGSIAYHRKRLIRFDIVWRVLLVAIPTSQIGVLLTGRTPGPVLMVATGVVLIYSAWIFIERGWKIGAGARPAEEPTATDPPTRRYGPTLYLAGAASGFVAGFLAIGGGIVLVPAFVKVLKLSTKEALATSLFCVALLAIPGTIGHTLEGNIDWDVALLLSLGVVPTGYIGARLATSLRSVTLEKIYGIVMMAFAIFFTIRSLLE